MTRKFTLTTPNGNFKIIGVPKNINPDDIGEKTKVYKLSDITEDMAKEWGYDKGLPLKAFGWFSEELIERLVKKKLTTESDVDQYFSNILLIVIEE